MSKELHRILKLSIKDVKDLVPAVGIAKKIARLVPKVIEGPSCGWCELIFIFIQLAAAELQSTSASTPSQSAFASTPLLDSTQVLP